MQQMWTVVTLTPRQQLLMMMSWRLRLAVDVAVIICIVWLALQVGGVRMCVYVFTCVYMCAPAV